MEKQFFTGSPLSIAEYTNYKEAKFLISVLGEPDLQNRIIPEDAGEKYYDTIIGYPLVAKLRKTAKGIPVDFGGHEKKVIQNKKGKHVYFDTIGIGSFISSEIVNMEVDGYDGEHKCIIATVKLWTSRFPEYFKVFDKLWSEGKLQSSWEITVFDSEKKDDFTIYKDFEIIGVCALGKTKTACVPGAGAIEYAEYEDDIDLELAEALKKDLADLDIENDEKKEEINLAETKKTTAKVTDEKEKNTPESVDEKETKKNSTAACNTDKKKSKTAEAEDPEVASLTQGDLLKAIRKACEEKSQAYWGYVAFWFPEEHKVWFKPESTRKVPVKELEYELFTYEVEGDVVTVSDPEIVELTVSIKDVNTTIASKDEKIGTLTAELDIKNSAIAKAGETINALKVQVSELEPYKAKVEEAEKAKIEAEIAEEKENLKSKLLKGGLFTEAEIAESEIAELIEARNVTAVNSLIADRYIEKFDSTSTEVAEVIIDDHASTTATASLEADDEYDSPSSLMSKILRSKK